MKDIHIQTTSPQDQLIEQILSNMLSEEEVFEFIKSLEAGFESFDLLKMCYTHFKTVYEAYDEEEDA